MPVRRSHNNSHHGCVQCKRRKVKCDESYPACLRCVKRHEVCSLSESVSNFVDSSAANSSISAQSVPAAVHRGLVSIESIIHQNNSVTELKPSIDLESSGGIAITDLEFVHQYLTKTCVSLDFSDSIDLWRDYLFEVGLSHRFVLYGIIATSALHKALSEPTSTAFQQRYLEAALRNQNIALSLFIPSLNKPDAENSVAICFFSILLSILTLGSLSLPENLKGLQSLAQTDSENVPVPDSPSSISILIEVITILGGTHTIIKETYKWLENSKLEAVLRPPSVAELPDIPTGAAETLELLNERARQQQQSHHLPRSYDAVPRQSLGDLYAEELRRLWVVCKCTLNESASRNILSWPTIVEKEFVKLLREREPLALAMVAFWAACFHTLNDRWWAKGWSVSLVEDVSRSLDPEWEPFLKWPKSVVQSSI